MNIVNNSSNNILTVYNKQEDSNLNSKKNDITENMNNNLVDKENNSNSNKNISSNTVKLNVNIDSNKSVADHGNGNNDSKHERNIDSFICNNKTSNNNFPKNNLINISSTEYFRNSNSNLNNQTQPNSNKPTNSDMKKNQTQQSNINKNQYSSNDSNTIIQTHNQENKHTINPIINQKSQDIINQINSSNKKIININDASLVSRMNSNLDSESRKLMEIKKNIYNASNIIDNQDHALTQKVPVNTNPILLKDNKKFNLNEHILNHANLKLANNTNINNQSHPNKKENEINPPVSKYNQIPTSTKSIINHSINNPIINYINNSSNVNINTNIKRDNQSNALSNFDKKRYNLKKFQTSKDSNLNF